MASTPLKIIAMGNSFYGDDGVGEAVLDVLREMPEMENVPLINGQTDALGLVDHFARTDHVIIIDAARMNCPAGTVQVFNETNVKPGLKADHLSLHGISLAETLSLARQIKVLPRKTTIIGIEPEQMDVNTGLSPAVKQAVPKVISHILTLKQD